MVERSTLHAPWSQIPRGAVLNPMNPKTPERWLLCPRAWRVAVCLSNSPSGAAWNPPSPNSLPLGIPQIRVLPGSCLNRA